MANILKILHRTEYRYDRPVDFGPHLLMLRPRDGHDMWVEDAFLRITPEPQVRWFFDTFGNSVAEASFTEPADTLSIVSELHIRRYPAAPHIDFTQGATNYPFRYSPDEAIDLGRYLALHNPHEGAILADWIHKVFPRRPKQALTLLRRLSDKVHGTIEYSPREEMGTQSAAKTIEAGTGTCRDFAFLFMEAARSLGFAARFVTGYLHDRIAEGQLTGGGSTHAWADVYIPGEGWIEFDPTNRIVGGAQLIRVATTRTPSQATPISGSHSGDAEFLGLGVSVEVSTET